jgi:hypothetical protein
VFALATQSIFAAPGLQFFRGLTYWNLVFTSLVAIGFFSLSITAERERGEDTLGLMLMAGISPQGILLGRSGGRMWQASRMNVAPERMFLVIDVVMIGIFVTCHLLVLRRVRVLAAI